MNRPDLENEFRDTGRRRTLKLGETLFAKGSKGEALYLVTSGRLRVVIQDLDQVSKTVPNVEITSPSNADCQVAVPDPPPIR